MTKVITIHIAGDSTAATKEGDRRPETGWGEKIGALFNQNIRVVNHAVNGRSTKSFIEEGRLKKISEMLEPGDFLLIQFGHNDQKIDEERGTKPFGDYQDNLEKFCQVALNKGANPILLTSVTRRDYLENGELNRHTLGEYPEAMISLAKKHSYPLLDIFSKSQDCLKKASKKDTKKYYLHLDVGEHPNYPEGVVDNTHFNDSGAQLVSELIVEEIKNNSIPLKKYLKEE